MYLRGTFFTLTVVMVSFLYLNFSGGHFVLYRKVYGLQWRYGLPPRVIVVDVAAVFWT